MNHQVQPPLLGKVCVCKALEVVERHAPKVQLGATHRATLLLVVQQATYVTLAKVHIGDPAIEKPCGEKVLDPLSM